MTVAILASRIHQMSTQITRLKNQLVPEALVSIAQSVRASVPQAGSVSLTWCSDYEEAAHLVFYGYHDAAGTQISDNGTDSPSWEQELDEQISETVALLDEVNQGTWEPHCEYGKVKCGRFWQSAFYLNIDRALALPRPSPMPYTGGDLATTTAALAREIGALMSDYPTDDATAPLSGVHFTTDGTEVGSSELQPSQVEWMREMVAGEAAACENSHPDRAACPACGGTGRAGKGTR